MFLQKLKLLKRFFFFLHRYSWNVNSCVHLLEEKIIRMSFIEETYKKLYFECFKFKVFLVQLNFGGI